MLRSPRSLGLWISLLFLQLSCVESLDMNPGSDGVAEQSNRDSQVQQIVSPIIQNSDRPLETGEGLPGYLIDPKKLNIDMASETITIEGSPGALLDPEGNPTSATGVLIGWDSKVMFNQEGKAFAIGQAEGLFMSQEDGSFTVSVARFSARSIIVVAEVGREGLVPLSLAGELGITSAAVASLENETTEFSSLTDSNYQVDQRFDPEDLRKLLITGECYSCILNGVNISGLSLQNAKLNGSQMTGAIMYEADLTGATIQATNLVGVDLDRAILKGANLEGSTFVGAEMEAVDFSEAIMYSVILEGVDAESANFTNAIMNSSNVTNAKFTNAIFDGASTAGIDFSTAAEL